MYAHLKPAKHRHLHLQLTAACTLTMSGDGQEERGSNSKVMLGEMHCGSLDSPLVLHNEGGRNGKYKLRRCHSPRRHGVSLVADRSRDNDVQEIWLASTMHVGVTFACRTIPRRTNTNGESSHPRTVVYPFDRVEHLSRRN